MWASTNGLWIFWGILGTYKFRPILRSKFPSVLPVFSVNISL